MNKFLKCKDCDRKWSDEYCLKCCYNYDMSKMKESDKFGIRDYYKKDSEVK